MSSNLKFNVVISMGAFVDFYKVMKEKIGLKNNMLPGNTILIGHSVPHVLGMVLFFNKLHNNITFLNYRLLQCI